MPQTEIDVFVSIDLHDGLIESINSSVKEIEDEIKRSLSDEANETISHQYDDIFGSNRNSAEIQNERKMFDEYAIFYMETLLTIKNLHSQLEKFVIGR